MSALGFLMVENSPQSLRDSFCAWGVVDCPSWFDASWVTQIVQTGLLAILVAFIFSLLIPVIRRDFRSTQEFIAGERNRPTTPTKGADAMPPVRPAITRVTGSLFGPLAASYVGRTLLAHGGPEETGSDFKIENTASDRTAQNVRVSVQIIKGENSEFFRDRPEINLSKKYEKSATLDPGQVLVFSPLAYTGYEGGAVHLRINNREQSSSGINLSLEPGTEWRLRVFITANDTPACTKDFLFEYSETEGVKWHAVDT